jgi:hypothetical protein
MIPSMGCCWYVNPCAGTRAYDPTYLAYEKPYDGSTLLNAEGVQSRPEPGAYVTKVERPVAIRGDLQREIAPVTADGAPDECGDKLATFPIDREMLDVFRGRVVGAE